VKRKTYATIRERKADQMVGLVSFLIINILLLATTRFWAMHTSRETYGLLLPWILNGGFVILAFIFRPQMGVGYLASFCIIFSGAIILGELFVSACFVAGMVSLFFEYLHEGSGILFYFTLFPVLFLVGLYFVGRLAVSFFITWWFSSENSLNPT
jgi:hypothetical protein